MKVTLKAVAPTVDNLAHGFHLSNGSSYGRVDISPCLIKSS
jgi:hypothetical protein